MARVTTNRQPCASLRRALPVDPPGSVPGTGACYGIHWKSRGYTRTDIDDHPLLVPSLFSGRYIQPADHEAEDPRNCIGMSSVAMFACTKSKPCHSAACRRVSGPLWKRWSVRVLLDRGRGFHEQRCQG